MIALFMRLTFWLATLAMQIIVELIGLALKILWALMRALIAEFRRMRPRDASPPSPPPTPPPTPIAPALPLPQLPRNVAPPPINLAAAKPAVTRRTGFEEVRFRPRPAFRPRARRDSRRH